MGLLLSSCFSCPPTIDTMHLVFEVRVTTGFLAVEKSSSAEEMDLHQLEQFHLKKCRLEGFSGYQWMGLGRDRFEGINVIWGPCQAPDNYPERRRVRVMIGSAQCWRAKAAGYSAVGLAGLVLDALEGVMLAQRPAPAAVGIRRLDVCCDHWGYEWTRDDLGRFATQAKTRASTEKFSKDDFEMDVYQGAKTATYYVGSRGAACRLLRVYLKTEEAKATGKLAWMEDAWRAHGWDGRSLVWRAEIEHGGQWLHDHGFTSMESLPGCEVALWEHYLDSVRHTTGDRAKLRTCEDSPAWQAIMHAVAQNPSGVWQWSPKPATVGADLETLLAQAAGCLESASRHLEASYLLPLTAGELSGMAASPDDRDAELLRLVQAYLTKKRLKEAMGKACKASL